MAEIDPVKSASRHLATNARSATLATVIREAQALETVGDSADRRMEVPGVSDNVQVSERVLFASWHCGVFGTTAPAILTGCYRLCLISTPPGLMPDNCNRLLPLPRPLTPRSPQLTRHCAFTSQRWNRECSQRFLRPSATTPLRLRKGKFCTIVGRLVNKGLGMLRMSSAKWSP